MSIHIRDVNTWGLLMTPMTPHSCLHELGTKHFWLFIFYKVKEWYQFHQCYVLRNHEKELRKCTLKCLSLNHNRWNVQILTEYIADVTLRNYLQLKPRLYKQKRRVDHTELRVIIFKMPRPRFVIRMKYEQIK